MQLWAFIDSLPMYFAYDLEGENNWRYFLILDGVSNLNRKSIKSTFARRSLC